jgi:hypothetical protein
MRPPEGLQSQVGYSSEIVFAYATQSAHESNVASKDQSIGVLATGERVWGRWWPVLAGDAAMAVGVIRVEAANAAAIAVDTSRFRMTYLR